MRSLIYRKNVGCIFFFSLALTFFRCSSTPKLTPDEFREKYTQSFASSYRESDTTKIVISNQLFGILLRFENKSAIIDCEYIEFRKLLQRDIQQSEYPHLRKQAKKLLKDIEDFPDTLHIIHLENLISEQQMIYAKFKFQVLLDHGKVKVTDKSNSKTQQFIFRAKWGSSQSFEGEWIGGASGQVYYFSSWQEFFRIIQFIG